MQYAVSFSKLQFAANFEAFFSLSILKLSKLNYYKVQTREPNGLIKVSHSSQLEISQLRRRHAKHYQGMQSFSD